MPYASGSPTQVLDLSLPVSDGTAPVPVVVLLHPGGFYQGDEDDLKKVADLLTSRGYATASIRYRLSTEAKFPAGAQDVKASVRWLRAHAGDYGLDGTRFVAWGYSAGAWFAAMLGVTGDQPTVFDDPELGNPDESSAVQVVVAWYGLYDFATEDAQAAEPSGCIGQPWNHGGVGSFESFWLGEQVSESALTEVADLTGYVGSPEGGTASTAKESTVWLFEHGDADCILPYRQTLEMAAALQSAGATVDVSIEAGYVHADPRFNEQPLAAALEFLAEVAPVS